MLTLSILALGAFDRLRGSSWIEPNGVRVGRALGQLGMGLVAALLLHVSGWQFAYVAAVVTGGSMKGFGSPLGAAFDGRKMTEPLEGWQFGILKRSIPLALAYRGLMWGGLLVFVNPLAPLALILPFTVAPYLARWFFPGAHRWAWMEFARGIMIGLGLALVGG